MRTVRESICLRLEQVLDFSPGLLFDPVVDILPRRRRRLAEVDREKPAVVVAFDQLLKFGEDSLARLRPECVGGREARPRGRLWAPAAGIVSVVQIGDQAMKRGVELGRRAG